MLTCEHTIGSSTLDAGRRAADNIARGAQRAGRRLEDIEIASLLPCNVSADRQRAFDAMRAAVGFYGGFFPRYNRLIAESGFPEAAAAIKTAWAQGGREAAARVVPDALLEAIAVTGTPEECRERIEAYRRSGITLPIISPRPGGPDAKQSGMEALRACAPGVGVDICQEIENRTMAYDFDRIIDRRHSDSATWRKYAAGLILDSRVVEFDDGIH